MINNEKINHKQSEIFPVVTFFWNSNKNPWGPIVEAIWTPFDLEDQITLRIGFNEFISDPNKTEIVLKSPSEWKINFSTKTQYKNKTKSQIRPILIDLSTCVDKIRRNERFYNKFSNKKFPCLNLATGNNSKIPKLSYQKFNRESLEFNIDNLKSFNFNIIQNHNIVLYISEKIYFKDEKFLDLTFDKMIRYLSEEIEGLEKFCSDNKFEKENSKKFYLNQLKNLENSVIFFEKIMNIFSVEGFLYKIINQILSKKNFEDFRQIKFCYLALSASFKYFSENLSTNYINGEITTNKDLFLYTCGGDFSDDDSQKNQEFSLNSSNPINPYSFRIFPQFLSCSKNLKFIVNHLDLNQKNKIEFIYEIYIPEYIQKYEPENLIFIDTHSEFPKESEVLLKDNSVIIINSIIPYENYENKFLIKSFLITFTSRSYLKLINMNNLREVLDLSNCEFCDDPKNFNFLKVFLLNDENKNFKNLNLCSNKLGENKENFIILKEILNGNNFINYVNLSNNKIGNCLENMIIIRDIFLDTNFIKELYLGGNNLGENPDNLSLIKEILKQGNSLEYLDISMNNLHNNKDNFYILYDMLVENTKLKEINLSGNNIGENQEYIKLIKDIFEENSSLKYLNLSSNNLGKNLGNVVLLKELILENRNLEKLKLTNNNFIPFIEKEFKNMTNLTDTLLTIL